MKVSVILPVYNGEKYMVPCLEALSKQSIEDYEVICVDDGSKDRSGEILEEYQRRFPDIFRVFHRENAGVYKAREFALQQAVGDYVGFCDCDDVADAEMYKKLYECAVQAQAEMSVCAYVRADAQTEKILCCEMKQFGDCVISVEENKDKLAIINTALWNKLIRRNIALKHIQFDNPPRVAEDMMFLLGIYPQMTRIAFCKEPLYRYYVREGSAMSHVKVEEITHLKLCMMQTKTFVENAAEDWKDVVNLFAFIHFGIAFALKSVSDKRKMKEIQRDMEQWLNGEFEGWRENPYLKAGYVFYRHGYLLKPMVVLWMYRIKQFSFFINVYMWITKMLKTDIKW